MTEREHCRAVAKEMYRYAGTHMALALHELEVADFIQRERAAARAEALEEAAEVAERLHGEAVEHALVLKGQGRRIQFQRADCESAALGVMPGAIRALKEKP